MLLLNRDLVITIWSRIIRELAHLQDAAPQDFRGQAVNSITQKVYLLDTACAAKAFATEYTRTKDANWNQRAVAAFESIPILKLASGLEEQIWNVYGWHDVPGSLAVTVMAFDALWDAMEIIGFQLHEEYASHLLAFLNTCRNGKGYFAHNSIGKQRRVPSLNNTTAAALYLIDYLARKFPKLKHPLFFERALILSRLSAGQDKNGYWQYIYPCWRRRLASGLPLLKNVLAARSFDRSVYHGDMMHQAMTLYFVAKYFLSTNDRNHFAIVSQGWQWIRRNLIRRNDEIEIDWNSEPDIFAPRYCNLRDTNTYFWILGVIPYLEKLNLIEKQEAVQVINGIIFHITRKLLKTNDEIPCIAPHEGPLEVLRNILPMLDQSVAWKACNLSEVIRYYL